MQSPDPAEARRGGDGEETPGARVTTLALVALYHGRRRELEKARAELEEKAAETKALADAFLEADARLVARLEREGEVAVGRSVYSAGPDGHLRWKPRPLEPAGWRRYTSPMPGSPK